MFSDEGINRQEVFLKGIHLLFSNICSHLIMVFCIKVVTNVIVKHLDMV